MKWRAPRFYERLRSRFRPEVEATTTQRRVRCPRCRRLVVDRERNRNAHRQSCVKIPRVRNKEWGQKERVW